jgi:histidine triad (HIT) family protein
MDCVFCRIAKGEIPAKKVLEDEHVVAFHDIHPQAPTHVLVIPKRHVASLADATDGDRDVLGRALLAARDVARAAGIADDGYRVIVNTRAHGGQEVFHVHLHVLGGRPLGRMVARP